MDEKRWAEIDEDWRAKEERAARERAANRQALSEGRPAPIRIPSGFSIPPKRQPKPRRKKSREATRNSPRYAAGRPGSDSRSELLLGRAPGARRRRLRIRGHRRRGGFRLCPVDGGRNLDPRPRPLRQSGDPRRDPRLGPEPRHGRRQTAAATVGSGGFPQSRRPGNQSS